MRNYFPDPFPLDPVSCDVHATNDSRRAAKIKSARTRRRLRVCYNIAHVPTGLETLSGDSFSDFDSPLSRRLKLSVARHGWLTSPSIRHRPCDFIFHFLPTPGGSASGGVWCSESVVSACGRALGRSRSKIHRHRKRPQHQTGRQSLSMNTASMVRASWRGVPSRRPCIRFSDPVAPRKTWSRRGRPWSKPIMTGVSRPWPFRCPSSR